MFRATLFTLALLGLVNPALADEVTDTLNSAMQAYEEGDIEYAIEELDYAKQLLKEMSTEELAAFLPEPPEGWTREVSQENMSGGLAFLGGGVGAEATYSNDSQSFTISITADNPMVTAFGGMIANAGMMGMKLQRVGREKFLLDDGEITGLIDNRILVKASGADVEMMVEVLKEIDFKALEDFGS